MSIYAAYRRQRNSATYLFAEHGHSERSEESQHVEIVIHWPINTCERGNHTTGLRPWKTSKPPCGRWKCTPFGTFGTTFPPEGELLAVLCIEVLMSSEAERRANFPLRGKSPQGNRGAFPSGVSPVVRFSIPRSGIIKLIARRAIPSPLNPLNPLNLLNPFSLHNPSAQPTAKPCPFRAHGNIVKHR